MLLEVFLCTVRVAIMATGKGGICYNTLEILLQEQGCWRFRMHEILHRSFLLMVHLGTGTCTSSVATDSCVIQVRYMRRWREIIPLVVAEISVRSGRRSSHSSHKSAGPKGTQTEKRSDD